ncbi:MAG: phage tail tube protein [Deltaproteobacteria bacterium]|nr:phage tail tube protein [Deltaproteobacteria bacterium]
MAEAKTNQVAGKLYVRVGGELLPITSEGTHSVKGLGGINRKTVMGLDKGLGYQEEAVEASVETTIALKQGYDPIALSDIVDATVQVETDAGHTFILANAWCKTPGDLGKDGQMTVVFAGPEWTKS